MKSKSTKKALTTSIISILLCLAMFIGSTFAWFTDTASTTVNKIQAGKLDVTLEMATAWNEEGTPTAWANAEGETLKFLQKQSEGTVVQSDSILWEPGCTYELPELKISNNGNLALKYKVVISGIKVNADLNDLDLNNAITWTITLDGSDYSINDVHKLNAKTNSATDYDILTIEGHMKEDAGNQYQGLLIDDIAITVYATQDTVEYDSYNKTYDQGATYPINTSSASELKTALTESNIGNVVLTDDITVDDGYDLVITGSDKSINFNNNTLKGSLSSGSTTSSDPDVNLVLSDPNNNGEKYSIDSEIKESGGGWTQTAAISAWKPTVTIESGRYTHDNAVILNQLQTSNADAVGVVINGGTFDGQGAASVVANVIGTVIINGGTFNAHYQDGYTGECIYHSYGSTRVPTITIINGGTFKADKRVFYVDASSSSTYTQKINVNGGTFTVESGGSLIEVSSGSASDYLSITGGTFNVDPNAYLADGYTATYNSGTSTWTVSKS